MEQPPIRSSFRISFVNVDVVGEHIDRKHGLRIEIDDSESWVQLAHWGDTTSDARYNDGFIWVSNAVVQLEVLNVRVANHVEPDDILEALHEGSEAHTPLMLARFGMIVANHDCQTTLRLNV